MVIIKLTYLDTLGWVKIETDFTFVLKKALEELVF